MDLVVTVPKRLWAEWIAEGDLPGAPWSGRYSFFSVSRLPDAQRVFDGEPRVYVVAHGRLRGYAPLYALNMAEHWITPHGPARVPEELVWRTHALVRRGDAVAVTIPEPIPGFRGWRWRWWRRDQERPFPDWQTAEVR